MKGGDAAVSGLTPATVAVELTAKRRRSSVLTCAAGPAPRLQSWLCGGCPLWVQKRAQATAGSSYSGRPAGAPLATISSPTLHTHAWREAGRRGVLRNDCMSTPTSPAFDQEQDLDLARSTLAFPVVGLGASAGGLTAVGHCSSTCLPIPAWRSWWCCISRRTTRARPRHPPARNAHAGAARSGETVPIGRTMFTSSRRPCSCRWTTATCGWPLERAQRESPRRIDLFFRSLAQAHRSAPSPWCSRAPAATARGAFGDMKAEGGVTLAQSPADAEYDGMPSAPWPRAGSTSCCRLGAEHPGEAGRAVGTTPSASSCPDADAPDAQGRGRPTGEALASGRGRR